jgi:coenzyme A diphosphatase NUDT7
VASAPLLLYSNFISLTTVHRYVLAAVLVLLYERAGGLRVLLTTRSKELRSHPGQTALPGGKVDQSDAGVVETAVSHLVLSLTPFIA